MTGSEAETNALGHAADAVPIGVAVFDAASLLVSANRVFGALFCDGAPQPAPGDGYAALVGRVSAMVEDVDDRLTLQDLSGRADPAATPSIHPMMIGLHGQWWEIVEQPGVNGGLLCLWSNVTRRMQAETEVVRLQGRLRDAIQSLPDGLALFDVDDRLEIHNNGFADIYRVDPDEALSGRTFADLLSELVARGLFKPQSQDLHAPRSRLRDVLDRHRRADDSMEIQLTDGRYIRVVERRTSDGGTIGLHSDVTRQKQRESELVAAKADAEAAVRAKSIFLNSMSHELRTPLNAIIGFSELLKDQALGPLGSDQYREFAQDIFDGGCMLLSMINDVLDMSRIEAGEHRLNAELIDLQPLIATCIGMMRDRAATGSVTLTDRSAGPAPALFADRRAVMKIVHNLLSNAVKFTPPGGSAWVAATTGPGGGPRIEVGDTGIGIEAAAIGRVFEPFRQADDGLNRRHDGAGLGLAVVKALADLMGGTVTIDSRPGEGTVVSLELPPVRIGAL